MSTQNWSESELQML